MRQKCDKTTCMANYDNECFADCDCGNPDRVIRMLDMIITKIDGAKERVSKSHGEGAVGALFGINDYLKEVRSKQEPK